MHHAVLVAMLGFLYTDTSGIPLEVTVIQAPRMTPFSASQLGVFANRLASQAAPCGFQKF